MGVEARLGKLWIEIDSSFKDTGFDQADKRTRDIDKRGKEASRSASTSFGAIGEKARSAGSTITKGLGLPLIAIGGFAFDAASDLEESSSKALRVFGDWVDSVEKVAETSATSMGIAKQEYLEAAGTFGNLFRAMGLGQESAAGMSKGIISLAADLASFNNANPEDVLLALRAGLVGESEPLRKFGVNITAARIETEAFRLGLVKGKDALKKQGGELTSAQKAQAAYSLIMQDTKLAQGDFARTAEGAANRLRILKAQAKDAAAGLGKHLLPIGIKILGAFGGLIAKFNVLNPRFQQLILIGGAALIALGPIVGVIGSLATVIGFLLSPVGLIVAALAAFVAGMILAWKHSETFRRIVSTVFMRVVDIFQNTFLPAMRSLWTVAKSTFSRIAAVVGPLATSIMVKLQPVIGFLTNLFEFLFPIWAGIAKRMLAGIGRAFELLAPIIRTAVSVGVSLFTTLVTVIVRVVNGIIHAINAVIRGINAVKPGKSIGYIDTFDVNSILNPGKTGEVGGRTGTNKEFAHGGLVLGGPIGTPHLATVHTGERIMDPHATRRAAANEDGGGGDVVLVLDGEVLARVARKRLLQMKRQTGTLGLA